MLYLKDFEFYKGMFFIFLFTLICFFISKISFLESLGFSILIISIIFGMVLSNIFTKYNFIESKNSLLFSTKQLLRFAIVLYGFRLTFQDLYDVGFDAFLYALIILISTFFISYIIGVKFLRIDKQIAILIGAGSSICGAAAVLATEAVLKNKAYKTSIAISTVVLFGTISMFLYPMIYNMNLLSLDEYKMAIFLGGTLHEVAHVVGAANSINSELVADNAVVTKMIRVMLLAPFLIFIALTFVNKKQEKVKVLIPWFAILFIVVIMFNSLNLLSSATINIINEIDLFLLAMAMFALGYNTKLKEIIDVGIKPIILAFILFLWLFIAGYLIVVFL
ncbi:YeiH family protein [Arcobacter sp. YIC-464]|uniref:YeiH family protein n=1 Tax=Arcobacter sp. YIC-464 TaxID=3376631 RepID=UPI003C23B011